MNKDEIETKLVQVARKIAEPFCYGCYVQVNKSKDGAPRCPTCFSDDLMNVLPGIDGPEFGTSWIIEHILAKEFTPVNVDEAFEESVRECYPETTQVGWMDLDTVSVCKEMDPISWRCAQGEWESAEEENETIVSFDGGNTYYWTHEIETYLEKSEAGAA